MPFFINRPIIPLVPPVQPVTLAGSVGSMTSLGVVGTTANYNGMTVASGATLLLVFVAGRAAKDSCSAVWDFGGSAQAMTDLTTTFTNNVNQQYVGLFGLLSPATGNLTLRLSFAGGGAVFACGAAAFNNTNTSNINSAVINRATQNTAGALVANQTESITVASGNMGVAFNHSDNSNASSCTWDSTGSTSVAGSSTLQTVLCGFMAGNATAISWKISPDATTDALAGIRAEISV